MRIKDYWRVIPEDLGMRYSKLWCYYGDLLDGENVQLYSKNIQSKLYLIKTKQNEDLINTLKWFDIIEISGEISDNTIVASDIKLIQRCWINIKDILKKLSWVSKKELVLRYPEAIIQLLNMNYREKFELFNFIVHDVDHYFYERWFFRVYLNFLQEYFQWWGLDGAYKVEEKYLKLTSEFDLRMLLSGGFGKIYHIGKSFRNLSKTSTALNEFYVLEKIQVGETLENALIEHINFLKKIVDNIPKKYISLLNTTNIETLKEGKVNYMPYQQYQERNHQPPQEWLYVIYDYPLERSPLWKHWKEELSQEYLLFCNGYCIWNLLQLETEIEALIRWLEIQAQSIEKPNIMGKNIITEIQKFWTPPAVWVWMWIESLVKFLIWEQDVRNINLFNKF